MYSVEIGFVSIGLNEQVRNSHVWPLPYTMVWVCAIYKITRSAVYSVFAIFSIDSYCCLNTGTVLCREYCVIVISLSLHLRTYCIDSRPLSYLQVHL